MRKASPWAVICLGDVLIQKRSITPYDLLIEDLKAVTDADDEEVDDEDEDDKVDKKKSTKVKNKRSKRSRSRHGRSRRSRRR